VQLVAPRLDNRENRAGEHGQERQPHQHKSRRQYVLPVPRALKHQGGEYAEKHEEETVAPKYLLRRKSQNGRQVKAKKHENIPGPKRRRGKHARHGRAQESKDKPAEQSISHDARVCLAWIETGYSSEVQWPERHAKNSGKHAFWKKDAEWF